MNKKEQDKVNGENRRERLVYVMGEVGGDFVWMLKCVPEVVRQRLTDLRIKRRMRR